MNYLQAALYQEIQHGNRCAACWVISSPAGDPYQTFYIPSGTFETLSAFVTLLETLEDAFIGAYTIATFEFAHLRCRSSSWPREMHSGKYTPDDLQYFAEVAATILGVESEHRDALGRDLANLNPVNNRLRIDRRTENRLQWEHSAVAALTPFPTSTTGPAYSLADALAGAPSVYLVTSGNPPPQM